MIQWLTGVSVQSTAVPTRRKAFIYREIVIAKTTKAVYYKSHIRNMPHLSMGSADLFLGAAPTSVRSCVLQESKAFVQIIRQLLACTKRSSVTVAESV